MGQHQAFTVQICGNGKALELVARCLMSETFLTWIKVYRYSYCICIYSYRYSYDITNHGEVMLLVSDYLPLPPFKDRAFNYKMKFSQALGLAIAPFNNLV